jgi:hypothetical protein
MVNGSLTATSESMVVRTPVVPAPPRPPRDSSPGATVARREHVLIAVAELDGVEK